MNYLFATYVQTITVLGNLLMIVSEAICFVILTFSFPEQPSGESKQEIFPTSATTSTATPEAPRGHHGVV